MTEQTKTLKEKISEDTALASCKKVLVIIAMLLLALTFSGAKITEANTFIFKLTFSKPGGLSDLLLLSMGFLLLKYYSLSNEYLKLYQESWGKKALKDPFFLLKNHYADKSSGFLVERLLPFHDYNHDTDNPNRDTVKCVLIPNLFLNSKLDITIFDNEHGDTRSKIIPLCDLKNIKMYPKAVYKIFYFWLHNLFREREYLELYSPILISFLVAALTVPAKLNLL
ncbi:hypothetical protein NDQ71_00935 [Pseudoalteromonas sp. KG3]|uniref:hypothetical protein n=1 Tax=Pseudoalteromonas sp. KG3 TaxID=2951137 RepID=UPI00265A2779|nr:hypothetical protein [Pseudoalteromonas sp. KG3]WKD23698.1 hypothetical protein NDQ71_00935 [Pseudoalteromonas sp. KG3]